MTQTPTEAQPAADPTVQPPSVVGFTTTEVGLLLRDAEATQRERAFESLQLDPDYFTDETVGFGLSSLVARGWSRVVGEGDVQVTGPAYLLRSCFESADRWTQIAFIDETGSDIAVYVQGEGTSMLLQPRGAGTWFVLFKLPEGRDAEVIRAALASAIDLAPESVAFFDTSTPETRTRFFVRKAEGGRWKYAVAPSEGPIPKEPGDSDIPVNDVDTAGLLDAIDGLLDVPGSSSAPSSSGA